uniref:LRRGT00023 n=1 Tax=Rattus norvegicus TaxID=10116 RepID=Q6TXH6_RAT|nr:LRRGT00023 [Rattus norvegicus]
MDVLDKLFSEIIEENFPTLVKAMDIQAQGTFRPQQMRPEKNNLRDAVQFLFIIHLFSALLRQCDGAHL